jgi:hypothetical protein
MPDPFSHPHPHSQAKTIVPEQALEALAYRRAGSAVAWVLFDLAPESVSLVERPRLPKKVDNRKLAERYALAELAGWAAQARLQPRDQPWSTEGARICELLLRPWSPTYTELMTGIQVLRKQARRMIDDPVMWCKVGAIANELLSQVRLDGADLVEICRAIDEALKP